MKKLFSGNAPPPTPACVEPGSYSGIVGYFCRGSWRDDRLIGAWIEANGIRIGAEPSSRGDSDLVGPLCRALVDAGVPDARLDLYDDRGMHCLIVRSIHQRAKWDLVERGGRIRWMRYETRLTDSESIRRRRETGSGSGRREATAASPARGARQEGAVVDGNFPHAGQPDREAA